MSKISAKLRDMRLSKQQPGGEQQQAAAGAPGAAPSKHAPPPPPPAAARKVETLHDAARWGDVAAAKQLIEGGADVNGKVGDMIHALCRCC